MMRQLMVLTAIVLFQSGTKAASAANAAHPRWFVGDWCYPEGRPLSLTAGVGYDADDSTTYRADGIWLDGRQSGTWRIVNNRLIERRTDADPTSLGKNERVDRTTITEFRRHGIFAIEMKGARIGWSVKCPVQ